MTKASLITLLPLLLAAWPSYGAPDSDLWDLWTPHNPNSATSVDHALWQRFLNGYVSAADDGVNRVDYRRAAEAEGKSLLTRYLDQLSAIDPRTLNRDEQFAYWINLYNAQTVQVVLAYPDKKSILRMGEKLFAVGPWDDVVTTIAGTGVTLNDIEHRILRPIWRDHRIHFAVNCASIGCPNLNKTAYTGANLEQLLDEGERAYLGHERGVLVLSPRRVQLSSIFKWYRDDFAADERALIETYIAKHRPDVAELIGKRRLRVSYDYNWDLNGL